MSKIPTIRDKWNGYLESVVPAAASAAQVIETRRAFYAGALAVMTINSRIGEPDVTEDEGCRAMDNAMSDLTEFLQLLRENRA